MKCFFTQQICALVTTVMLLSGCVSFPDHSVPLLKETASISGDFVDLMSFYADGGAHVKIMKVDGKAEMTFATVVISSGSHTIDVYVTNTSAVSNLTFEVDAKGGKRYQFISNLKNGIFEVRLEFIMNLLPNSQDISLRFWTHCLFFGLAIYLVLMLLLLLNKGLAVIVAFAINLPFLVLPFWRDGIYRQSLRYGTILSFGLFLLTITVMNGKA